MSYTLHVQTDMVTRDIDWRKGQTVRRDWPTLKVVQSLLHMTDRQIDELFILAGSL